MSNVTKWRHIFIGMTAGIAASACSGEPSSSIIHNAPGSNLTFDLGAYHFIVPRNEVDYLGLKEKPPGVSFTFSLPSISAANLVGNYDSKSALQHVIYVTIEDSDPLEYVNVLYRIVHSYTANGDVDSLLSGFTCKSYTRGNAFATHWIGCAPVQKPELELILCTNDDLPIPRRRVHFAFREFGVFANFPRSYVSEWKTIKARLVAKLSSYIDHSHNQ